MTYRYRQDGGNLMTVLIRVKIIIYKPFRMTDFEKYSLIVSGAAAIGTIILAVIAIFGNWLKRLFIKPKIEMVIDSCKPYVELVKESNPNESDETSYKKVHLKITNKGRQTAINSQVLVEKIFKKREENQTYFLYKSFIPSNFLWVDEDKSKPITTSISHFIEVSRIQKYQEFSGNDDSTPSRNRDLYRLWISVENSAIKGSYLLLGKGTFLMPIIFYSDSIKNPHTIFIEIFWNSDNLSEMNESNFYVKLLKRNELTNEVKAEL